MHRSRNRLAAVSLPPASLHVVMVVAQVVSKGCDSSPLSLGDLGCKVCMLQLQCALLFDFHSSSSNRCRLRMSWSSSPPLWPMSGRSHGRIVDGLVPLLLVALMRVRRFPLGGD